MEILFLIFPIVAFLLGSIPFGLCVARRYGVQLRKVGSGNIGATNVFRSVGKVQGVLCFVLDFLKGALPVLLAVNMLAITGKDPLMQWEWLSGIRVNYPTESREFIQGIHVITGLCAILGHNYSPWIGFKGGKGVATSAGVIFALMPVGFALVFLIWLTLTFTTRYVAVGSVGAAIAFPLLVVWGACHHKVDHADLDSPSLWEAGENNLALLAFAVVASLSVLWRHRGNLQRLRKGTEHRFKKHS